LLQDRFAAIKGADYVFNAARHLGDELRWDPDGRVVARAKHVLNEARDLLREVKNEGMFSAIARGAFADVKRPESGGRGLAGVVEKQADYVSPILEALEAAHVWRARAQAPARAHSRLRRPQRRRPHPAQLHAAGGAVGARQGGGTPLRRGARLEER